MVWTLLSVKSIASEGHGAVVPRKYCPIGVFHPNSVNILLITERGSYRTEAKQKA